MNKSLVKCSKKKQKLYNKFLKNRNIENENKYKNYKYFYQNLLKNEKKQFYSNKIYECKSDIKKTWSVINNIMGRNKTSSLLPLNITINDINIHCPTQISKEFNNYFTNVGLNLANKIVPPFHSFNTYLNSANKNLLCDSELTLKEIDEAFSSLKINKSPGFDGISSNIVIFNKNHIIKPLFHVLKLSINEGVFPETLKVAKVYTTKARIVLISRIIDLYPYYLFFLKYLNALCTVEFMHISQKTISFTLNSLGFKRIFLRSMPF